MYGNIRLSLLLLLSFYEKIHYKEDLGGGTAIPETADMERVKRNQKNISTVYYIVDLIDPATPTPHRSGSQTISM